MISFESAIHVFVRGFCEGKSITHPYEHFRLEKLWVMRDGVRKNPRDYRKEEYIVHGTKAKDVDSLARQNTRGRFFVGVFVENGQSDGQTRSEYKSLNYRLIATEPFFVHALKRIPKEKSAAVIRQVSTMEDAVLLGKATRSRPLREEFLGKDAPFRQYIAILDDKIVGWVRSVNTPDGNWVSNLEVISSVRRRGIGSDLLVRLLKDDRKLKRQYSVLLSTHAGAMLYPIVGYQQIGTLYLFAPKRN